MRSVNSRVSGHSAVTMRTDHRSSKSTHSVNSGASGHQFTLALAAHDAAAHAWRGNGGAGAHRLDGQEMDFINGAENDDVTARSAGHFAAATATPPGSGAWVAPPPCRAPLGGDAGDPPPRGERPGPSRRAPALAALALAALALVALIVSSLASTKGQDQEHPVWQLDAATPPSDEGGASGGVQIL